MREKKNIILLIISILCIAILGIVIFAMNKTKEEQEQPTFVDGSIAIYDITDQMDSGLITNEERAILKEAPRTDTGQFDTSHFTKEQLEIYEKMLTNKFVDFTNDEAKQAAINFFNNDISSVGYKEYASITFDAKYLDSEEGQEYANVVYSGEVEDRRTDMHIDGTVYYYTTPSKSYEAEVYLSKTDGYYYTFLGEDLSEASSITVRDADLYELFNDLAFIFSKIDEVVVIDKAINGYVCEFTIPAELIVQSTLLNKQYVNSIFQDYGLETKGTVFVNTETKQIGSIEFKQTILDPELYKSVDDIALLNLGNEAYEMATYTVGYEFTDFNIDYNYIMDTRETAEILEAYYLYLLENPEETKLLTNGGTEYDIEELHKSEAQKEAERQMLEQLEAEGR